MTSSAGKVVNDGIREVAEGFPKENFCDHSWPSSSNFVSDSSKYVTVFLEILEVKIITNSKRIACLVGVKEKGKKRQL